MLEHDGTMTLLDKFAWKDENSTRTIRIVFDEGRNCVLKSATYHKDRGSEEKLTTACEKRRDPFVFSTLPMKTSGESVVDTPFYERRDELEGYAARTVRFERSAESGSDLYRLIDPPKETRVEIKNEGKRALRFLTPDGKLRRVPAGYMETIWANTPQSEITAEECPTAKIRVTVDATTEMAVSALEMVGGSWCEIGSVTDNTAELNDYLLRVRGVGGSLLGVLQTTTAYSGKPAIAFVDCKRYGVKFSSVRNTGDRGVLLKFPEDGGLEYMLEPDGVERPLAEILKQAGKGQNLESILANDARMWPHDDYL